MIKFKRLTEKDIANNILHRWLTFLDKSTPETILKEVINMDAVIQKADEKMAFISQDKDALRLYQMREKALSDYVSGMNHAKREGRREGRKEGIVEGRKEGRKEGELKKAIEIAKKMLKRGTPLQYIIEDTGLTEDEINYEIR